MNKSLLATAMAAAIAALTPAGAQRLLTQSERYGNGYDIDNNTVSTLTQNFYDPESRLSRANEVSRMGDGTMQLQNYSSYTYDGQGREVSRLTRRTMPTSPDNEDGEYTFVNRSQGTTEYDARGNKTRSYEQSWNSGSQAWVPAPGKEWDYNADGTVKEQREWISQYKPENPGAPQNTTTYTYDAQGRTSAARNDGAWPSSKWEETYTYDADGNKLQALRMNWAAEPATFVQRITYAYDGQGRLTSEVKTIDKGGVESNSLKTTYDYPAGDAQVVKKAWEWNTSAQEWRESSGKRYIDYYSDFTGKADMAPELRLSAVQGSLADLEAMFMVTPKAAALNARYDIYRDGYLIASKTVDELKAEGRYESEAQAGMVVLPRQPQGSHEYMVQLMLPDNAGQYQGYFTSEVVAHEVALECPAVSALTVTGVEMTTKQGVNTYHVSLSWQNPTAVQMADYGFKRHEFFCDAYATRIAALDDANATTITLDLDEPTGTVRVRTDYELGTATTADIPYAYGQGESLNAWGFVETSTATELARFDMSKPAQAPESVWDLEPEGVMFLAAGSSMGSSYVGIYDDDNWTRQLAAFNFEQKTMTPLREITDEGEYAITDLAYDAVYDDLYAIGYEFDENYNYMGVLRRMDTATSMFYQVATFPVQVDRIAFVGSTLYGMASHDYDTWQLYRLDPDQETATEVPMQTLSLDYYDNVNLLSDQGKLMLTVGKQVVTIDPQTGSWTKSAEELARAVSGLTFRFSTTDPDITVGGDTADSRVVYRSTSFGDVMGMTGDDTAMNITNNYYDFDNRLIASVQDDRGIQSDEFSLAYYTAYTYDEAGRLLKSERKQYGDFDYGMPGFETVEAVDYTYDQAGQLTQKRDGDDWNRYAYGAQGELATETIGCGDDTYQVLTYTYEPGQTKNPVLIASASPNHPDWDGNIYWEVREYADNGQIAKSTVYANEERTEIRTQTTYDYFDGTSILSKQESFTGNELTPDRRTTWTPVDGDMDRLEVQPMSYWDGKWYTEPGRRIDEYVDYAAFRGLTEKVNLKAQADEDQMNTAVLTFNAPLFLMYQQGTLDIYRDGQLLKSLDPEGVNQYMDPDQSVAGPVLVYRDTPVRNGHHTYFVQPSTVVGAGELDQEFTYQPLQASQPATLAFDLPLPAVTGLHVTGESIQAMTDPQTGSSYDATVATLAWTNPADADRYGFQSNNVFLDSYMRPTATVTSGASAPVDLGEATSVTMFVQSRYVYGYANSETIDYQVGTVGVDGTYAAPGLTLTVASGLVRVSVPAQIDVFDMAGRRVASAFGTSLDLGSHQGAYIVTATAPQGKAAVKVAL